MGPDNNSELFESHAKPRLNAIGAETERRELLSKTIAELSQLLNENEEPYRHVTEPTLFPRLFALLQLKFTPASIAGFYEISPKLFAVEGNVIQAKAAPHHDEYHDVATDKTYQTRVIQIKLNDPENSDLEFFGINIYEPQPDVQFAGLEDETKSSDPAADAYLALRKKGNNKAKDVSPITGQTVLITVRNKKTNDAKVFSIKFVSEIEENTGQFDEEEDAIISMSVLEDKGYISINGNRVMVEVLKGKMLHQAVFEIQASIHKLRELKEDQTETSQQSLSNS